MAPWTLRAQTTETAPSQAAKPKLEIVQSVFDAGDLYRSGSKLEHTFVLKNTGKSELKILKAQPG